MKIRDRLAHHALVWFRTPTERRPPHYRAYRGLVAATIRAVWRRHRMPPRVFPVTFVPRFDPSVVPWAGGHEPLAMWQPHLGRVVVCWQAMVDYARRHRVPLPWLLLQCVAHEVGHAVETTPDPGRRAPTFASHAEYAADAGERRANGRAHALLLALAPPGVDTLRRVDGVRVPVPPDLAADAAAYAPEDVRAVRAAAEHLARALGVEAFPPTPATPRGERPHA